MDEHEFGLTLRVMRVVLPSLCGSVRTNTGDAGGHRYERLISALFDALEELGAPQDPALLLAAAE